MFNYDRLSKILEEKKLSAYQIAKDTSISQSSFNDWKRKRSAPSYKKLKILSEYLGVSVEYLAGEVEERTIKPEKKEHTVQMPLYAQICCGNGGFVDDDIIEYISLPDSILNGSKEYFAQYAKGDSMVDANINEGDLLIFEKTNVLDNGQIGCFCVDNNDATCKKFYKTDSGIIMLQPANDAYDPIAVTVENTCFRILGKLALTISKTNY